MIGQGSIGKTSLADALLFAAGKVNRLGRVDDGSSLFDFEPEETRHRVSISTALHHLAWRKHELTIVDTPGHANFLNESRQALRRRRRGGDGAVSERASEGRAPEAMGMGSRRRARLHRVRHASRQRSDGPRTGSRAHRQGARDPGGGALTADRCRSGAHGLRRSAARAGGRSSRAIRVSLAKRRSRPVLRKPPSGFATSSSKPWPRPATSFSRSTSRTDRSLPRRCKPVYARACGRAASFPVLCGSSVRMIGVHALLDLIVDCLGSPVDVPPIRGANPKSGDEIERPPDPGAPFSAFVFKTTIDPFAGKLSIFRVESGRLKADSGVLNSTRDAKERDRSVAENRGQEAAAGRRGRRGRNRRRGQAQGDAVRRYAVRRA